MSAPDASDAVAARCEDCERPFYVTEEPERCPYCGGEVGTEYGVVVRPH